MSKAKKPTAIEKRAQNREALARFDLEVLKLQLPLVFPRDPDLPPSPKRRYRSDYYYLGFEQLEDVEKLNTLSSFEMGLQLFDFGHLEPLLAAHIYCPSAKGQTPFHPVSMYVLSLFRRERKLSRREALRVLRHEDEGRWLRRYLRFEEGFPSESGLRYFEGCITPELQQEINALQVEALYQAGLLPNRGAQGRPTKGDDEEEEDKATLTFDGMLHEARSRMRCAHARASCYQPSPRGCPARAKGKQGCDCATPDCDQVCRYTTLLDPEARLIAYSGNKKRRRKSPNAPTEEKGSGQAQRPSRARLVYGYYSYAGQLLDDGLSTYWILPGTFGPATRGDGACFPETFTYLRARFPWLAIGEVIADAGAGDQTCLDLIWQAGALRLVDIHGHKSDDDPQIRLARGYDEKGYPLCPFGYRMRSNGHDYQRRRTKWRCCQVCLTDTEHPAPDCNYLKPGHKHGYTVTVGRTHADGTVRLAREIPYGSAAWKARYNRRNSAESRNSALKRLGLKRLPVHGLSRGYVTVLQGDFVANQRTLVRLIREATAPRLSAPP